MTDTTYILVADASLTYRMTIKELLEDQHFRVRVAADGDAVKAIIHEEAPAIIIIDDMLPQADGFAICQFIRDANQQIPMILLISQTGAVRPTEAASEFKSVLLKPFDADELVVMVKAVLHAPVPEIAQHTPECVKKYKILVVDDSLTIRMDLSELLAEVGYAVTTAENGVKALAIFDDYRPDLLLLDVIMPEMDGIAVCCELRKKPMSQQVPVIMITSKNDVADKIKGLNAGADDYLFKPYNPHEVIAKVNAIFRMKKVQLESERNLLIEKNRELERLNQQLKLSAADLKIAKHLADASSVAKSNFLANMSHEIRTPMNAIIGMSHLALQTELTDKQRGYLANIQSSSHALLGVINDILDFSKIEAGKLAMEAIEFTTDDILDHLASMVSIKAEEKGLELIFSLPEDVPRSLIGDPLRLGQVLTNLANNAIKFTDKGEVFIGFELLDDTQDKICLRFTVRDTGIGMSSAQMTSLFQSFTQVDVSTTRKYGGTGLGLSICKRLVAMFGGGNKGYQRTRSR